MTLEFKNIRKPEFQTEGIVAQSTVGLNHQFYIDDSHRTQREFRIPVLHLGLSGDSTMYLMEHGPRVDVGEKVRLYHDTERGKQCINLDGKPVLEPVRVIGLEVLDATGNTMFSYRQDW
ncbi:MAG: hypothetical protein HY512_00445 [Candidatus Aenigmarchaeota archaeon]|nr:hypothetical protein [Candidatus Aenigmarchaeota archaeon]